MVPASIARHECKFRVHVDVLPRIIDALMVYCEADRHATTGPDGLYTIDSLYFDTDRFDLFWLTEEGAAIRSKIRVRSYVSPAGRSEKVKLEVKFRRNAIVTKTSASVPERDWARLVRSPADAPRMRDAEEQDAFDKFAMEVVRYHAVPKVMVRYQRAAFFSRLDDYVRITFDRRIQSQAVYDYAFLTHPGRWQAIDDAAAHGGLSHVIMEIKFKQVPPPWVVSLVRHFDLHQNSFSKYGNAVRRQLLESPPPDDRRLVRPRAGWITAADFLSGTRRGVGLQRVSRSGYELAR
jgi:SPX domain protein involved in polyphosphate accumulation